MSRLKPDSDPGSSLILDPSLDPGSGFGPDPGPGFVFDSGSGSELEFGALARPGEIWPALQR